MSNKVLGTLIRQLRAAKVIVLLRNQDHRMNSYDIESIVKEGRRHTEELLQRLVRKGVLNSMTGKNGGYAVTDKGRDLKLSGLCRALCVEKDEWISLLFEFWEGISLEYFIEMSEKRKI